MDKCIECGLDVEENMRGSLCESCFDQQLKSSIHEKEVVLKVDINHPSNEYF